MNDKVKKSVEKINEFTDIMNQGVNQINEYADIVNQGVNQVNDFVDYAEKAKKFVSYWSPENEKNRNELKRQVEQWKQKESAMVKHYFILWGCVIVLTVIICTSFV